MHVRKAVDRTDRLGSRRAGGDVEVERSVAPRSSSLPAAELTALQRTVGNAAVAGMLAGREDVRRSPEPVHAVGGGHSLAHDLVHVGRQGESATPIQRASPRAAGKRKADDGGAGSPSHRRNVRARQRGEYSDSDLSDDELIAAVGERQQTPVPAATEGQTEGSAEEEEEVEEAQEEDFLDPELPDDMLAAMGDLSTGTESKGKEKAAVVRTQEQEEEAFKGALMQVLRESKDPKWSVRPWSGKGGRLNFRAYVRQATPVEAGSFVDRREVQALTWISTIISEYLDKVRNADPGEVQAAIGLRGQLIVSTNFHRTNDLLRGEVGKRGGGLLEALIGENKGYLTKKPLRRLVPFSSGDEHKDREEEFQHWERNRIVEHQTKADQRLVKRTDRKSAEYQKIHDALAKGFEVPENTDVEDGYHAERRIARHNRDDQGGEVTPTYLAGTKRPCISCLLSLHGNPAEAGVRPGALFGSARSNIGIDGYAVNRGGDHEAEAREFVKNIVARLGGVSSFKTLTWDHRDGEDPAFDWPTDATSESDTDAGGNPKPSRKEQLRRRKQL